MKTKNDLTPLSEEILLRTEGVVCASDLDTDMRYTLKKVTIE